jgi:hypothetical protein
MNRLGLEPHSAWQEANALETDIALSLSVCIVVYCKEMN